MMSLPPFLRDLVDEIKERVNPAPATVPPTPQADLDYELIQTPFTDTKSLWYLLVGFVFPSGAASHPFHFELFTEDNTAAVWDSYEVFEANLGTPVNVVTVLNMQLEHSMIIPPLGKLVSTVNGANFGSQGITIRFHTLKELLEYR